MNDTDAAAVHWLTRYAELLGVDPPAPADIATLLELAGEAAHRSHRQAAPVACWLAAGAGISPQQALELAKRVVPEISE